MSNHIQYHDYTLVPVSSPAEAFSSLLEEMRGSGVFPNGFDSAGLSLSRVDEFQRFATKNDWGDEAGWLYVHQLTDCWSVYFGNWRGGGKSCALIVVRPDWKESNRKTRGEQDALQEQAEERAKGAKEIAKSEQEERIRLYDKVASQCHEKFLKWCDQPATDDFPYYADKGVHAAPFTRIAGPEAGPYEGWLAVPLCRISDRAIRGLQYISPKGEKRFEKGCEKKGNAFTIGDLSKGGMVYLCEGLATGLSIFESLQGEDNNSSVVVAFDCGNLPKVAEALKQWAEQEASV